MIKNLICALTGILLATTLAKAQGGSDFNSENFIEWNEFYNLRWEDFQGMQMEGRVGDAGTAIQIKAKPYMVRKKVMYNVYALFDKTKSWSNEKSETLLAHERLHFDIAEWYARLVRKKIEELRAQRVNDVSVYNAAIRVILEESNETDKLYDIETLHGALTKQQSAWEQKVKSELESLKEYKKPQRVVTAP